jgi:hypothetical protein
MLSYRQGEYGFSFSHSFRMGCAATRTLNNWGLPSKHVNSFCLGSEILGWNNTDIKQEEHSNQRG